MDSAEQIATQIVPELAGAPQLATPKKLRRLDLACGQNCTEGFEGVDLLADAQHKVDLCKFPWPFEDDSIDEIVCSHFIEHIPARAVEPRDLVDANPQTLARWVDVDMLFAFFDECWRILRPEGKLRVICPALRSNRAFQDPTHRRFIAAETFAYLFAGWRKANKLDHYRVRCNFGGNCNPTIPSELALLSPEVQARRFSECWNTTVDWVADLVAIKG